ncbi:hypothetical protein [Deinococcus aquiradiocola]|uniref:Uncharacterized protein n=1 Tax=Deinococcus aquiradiocola TaxID=393059 RepID=A0A917PNF1_9DEIO|nr:hypothetical protein [Deinococcus aquiradiocola]GGJ85642.1 hypothetical protein GCM10008939_31890 [Deinococcus aquiradiocola]
MTDHTPDQTAATRPDPADTTPAEGQSRDIPAQDQGKDQGVDTAYDAPPAEGARDDD